MAAGGTPWLSGRETDDVKNDLLRCRTCMFEWFEGSPSKCRCARRGWTSDVVNVSERSRSETASNSERHRWLEREVADADD